MFPPRRPLRLRGYDVDATSTSLEQHGRGIHAVSQPGRRAPAGPAATPATAITHPAPRHAQTVRKARNLRLATTVAPTEESLQRGGYERLDDQWITQRAGRAENPLVVKSVQLG